ncbi:uncharacterized protein [Antedon mediterranea]|uniref:uncharacterized protein n=1 Tax=Antedon mediterranea TaxID=105859 RepID=UPI003AF80946
MASYVMAIDADHDAFLEETQNLVLKMLGVVPSELEFDNDDDFEVDQIVIGKFQSIGFATPQVEMVSEKICLDCFEADDLETDALSVPLEEDTPVLAARVDLTEEERRVEEAVEKLEKMAQQILSMYKDDFDKLEADLESNGSYTSFSSFMQKIIPSSNPMWYKVSMLFGVSRYLVKSNKEKAKQVSGITSFTVEYIKNNFADYIIENGGWDSFASVGLQEIEGEMFCEISSMEKAAFENILPSQVPNETKTDGKPEEGSEREEDQEAAAGDTNGAAGSSLFELTPFVITASAAAAAAVAYAVMKT